MVRIDLEEKKVDLGIFYQSYENQPVDQLKHHAELPMVFPSCFVHILSRQQSGSARPCSFFLFLFNTLSMHTCPVSHVQLFATPWSPARLLCQWNFPGKKYWSGLPFLLQRTFPTQESNLCLLRLLCLFNHCATWEAPVTHCLFAFKHSPGEICDF